MEKLFAKTPFCKAVSTATIAAIALIGASTAAAANEARLETSDRTPTKETKTPLTQVDSVNGSTSDRTPGNTAADAASATATSDRTPNKASKTPLPQVDKLRDETSDRTPGNG